MSITITISGVLKYYLVTVKYIFFRFENQIGSDHFYTKIRVFRGIISLTIGPSITWTRFKCSLVELMRMLYRYSHLEFIIERGDVTGLFFEFL